ncbi:MULTISPECIES: hypothetical protein [Pseudoalteromonas]|uniref:Uncharacterized protein n=1 Tax=Pseudoalteromonas luteoviolacea (strain 2ta16) TaxID=1353533 RepID=V4GYV5_PSEL2|nr:MULTISPECIES: hypothetical protein [Pseudoalteromonas]ESP90331.1 hypothetical protein PL2TA16_02018 [Pseudoalteromonas luteoviolacea 2ta16]KZN39893.1 hypothetical protein N483_18735 [Pseudoalteromonas luteoviolacea NCIMB 1944]MCG7547032.1 hypothetical protein [Pseudoalteromonas sp. Of7M-16]
MKVKLVKKELKTLSDNNVRLDKTMFVAGGTGGPPGIPGITGTPRCAKITPGSQMC